MSVDLADRWCHLLGNIADFKLRADLLRAELGRRNTAIFAHGVRIVIERYRRGDPDAARVIATLVPAFAHREADESRSRLLAFVAQSDWPEVQDCLGCHPDDAGERPRISDDANPAEAQQKDRPLTLGERKSLARHPDQSGVARALRDPHPAVVEILLGNPALTEDRVVRIASNRLAEPDTMRMIAAHTRWCVQPRVRSALAQNPKTPPYLAAPLVCLLGRARVDDLLALPDLAPWLRRAALRVPAT